MPSPGQRLANGLEHVGVGNVLLVAIFLYQGVSARGHGNEEVGLYPHQSRSQPFRDVEVIELFIPVETARLNVAPHHVVDAFMLEPHHKACDRVLLRQAHGLEQDAQQGHAHGFVARAGAQCARRRVQAAVALRLDAELLELVAHALWQVRDTPRGGAIVKRTVHPQRPQHLDQVRLARAEEAADPHPRLLRLVDVLEIGLQYVDQALLVLAIADEGVQLIPQNP